MESAAKIAKATGVSRRWLMGEGPKTKPVTERGGAPLNRSHYEFARKLEAALDTPLTDSGETMHDWMLKMAVTEFTEIAAETMADAKRLGEQAKVTNAVDNCLAQLLNLHSRLALRANRRGP